MLAALLVVGCSGQKAAPAQVNSFISQLESLPQDQVESFVAGHQDEVRAAMADPATKDRYLKVVMARMPRNAPPP